MFLFIGNDFFDDGRNGSGAAITDRLPSNFQDIDIRKEALLGSYLKLFNKRPADQALSHQFALDMQTLAVSLSY
jgi:hypothetical protein